MPEISDEDFALLNLSKTALGSNATRMKTLRVFKEAKPDEVLPELDADNALTARVAPLEAENKKLREDIDKRASEALLKEKRDAIKARGLDVAAVEKIMMEKGITNHESAAEFLVLNSRPATPVASRSWDRSAKVPTNEGLKINPNAWAREEAAKVLDEFQAAKR